jgi:hypothetical protein
MSQLTRVGVNLMALKTHALLALTFCLVVVRAEAATTITPVAPSAQDVITAIIDVPNTSTFGRPSTTVTRNTIRTDLPLISVIGGPPPIAVQIYESFGPLPPGTYVYEVDETSNGHSLLISQQMIVVAPAIPAMNHVWLSILAVFLAAIACFAIERHA